MRPATDLDDIGIAGDQPNGLIGRFEQIGDDLAEAGLVALAGRQRADDDVDMLLARIDGDLGALSRRPGRQVDVVGDADAAQPAARACGRAPRLEPGPVGELHRLLHAEREVA